MKIGYNPLLDQIFNLKGNYTQGIYPDEIGCEGVAITPYRSNAEAAACISADFELAWAWREFDPVERDNRAQRGRKNVEVILDILESHSVPMTWATVGHLFLDSCSRINRQKPHHEIPRPISNDRWAGDWYQHDPCSDWQSDPLWYCPDLIRMIIDNKVQHEIGTHTFSHIDFAEGCADDELVEREISKCVEVMADWNLKPRSLIYPFNNMGHRFFGILSKLGVTSVRHRDQNVRLSYPESSPEGVFKIYESMNLRSTKRYNYVDKAYLFIQRAKKRFGTYHLWIHPSDRTEVFTHEFNEIVALLAEEHRNKKIWLATMQDIAAYCEARSRTTLKLKKTGSSSMIIDMESDYDEERYGSTEITLKIDIGNQPKSLGLKTNSGIEPVSQSRWRYLEDSSSLILDIEPQCKASIYIEH